MRTSCGNILLKDMESFATGFRMSVIKSAVKWNIVEMITDLR